MASSSSSSPATAAGSSATKPPLPTPPSPAKKGLLRRIIPFLFAANLAVGVYVFVRSAQKQSTEDEKAKKGDPTPSPASTEAANPLKKPATEPIPAPIKVLPPIPEQDQRKLFEWILEEKRKVKPVDKISKKKLDEEKALLKQFIRSKSIPSL